MVFRSQSEHEAINAREYPGTRELCCDCGEPTGRAGRGEDSIYRIVAKDFPPSPYGGAVHIKKGDEIGPLCEGCNHRLAELGLLKPEE